MNKYEIILKAYETGNITKTAESLNYTQSAVSQAINNYEKELGFAIFIRSKSGVSPTADGLRTVSYTHLDVYKRQLRYAVFHASSWPIFIFKGGRSSIECQEP